MEGSGVCDLPNSSLPMRIKKYVIKDWHLQGNKCWISRGCKTDILLRESIVQSPASINLPSSIAKKLAMNVQISNFPFSSIELTWRYRTPSFTAMKLNKAWHIKASPIFWLRHLDNAWVWLAKHHLQFKDFHAFLFTREKN